MGFLNWWFWGVAGAKCRLGYKGQGLRNQTAESRVCEHGVSSGVMTRTSEERKTGAEHGSEGE